MNRTTARRRAMREKALTAAARWQGTAGARRRRDCDRTVATVCHRTATADPGRGVADLGGVLPYRVLQTKRKPPKQQR